MKLRPRSPAQQKDQRLHRTNAKNKAVKATVDDIGSEDRLQRTGKSVVSAASRRLAALKRASAADNKCYVQSCAANVMTPHSTAPPWATCPVRVPVCVWHQVT